MSKIILAAALLCFALASFGQKHKDTVYTKEYYLKKSKNERTAAWVLLASGTALGVAGFIVGNNSDPYGEQLYTGAYMVLGGILVDLVSVPYFIGSAHSARKAKTAKISLNNQKILFPQYNSFIVKTQPSITLRIGL